MASSVIGHANKYLRPKVMFLNVKAELCCKSLRQWLKSFLGIEEPTWKLT